MVCREGEKERRRAGGEEGGGGGLPSTAGRRPQPPPPCSSDQHFLMAALFAAPFETTDRPRVQATVFAAIRAGRSEPEPGPGGFLSAEGGEYRRGSKRLQGYRGWRGSKVPHLSAVPDEDMDALERLMNSSSADLGTSLLFALKPFFAFNTNTPPRPIQPCWPPAWP